MAQWLACWAHNPKVRGSKPRSAITRRTNASAMLPNTAPRAQHRDLGLTRSCHHSACSYSCSPGPLGLPARRERAAHEWYVTFTFTDAETLTITKKEMQKADSTRRSSQAVPHPSTNRALRRLTSEIRRDPVHSTRYGRQRIMRFCQ